MLKLDDLLEHARYVLSSAKRDLMSDTEIMLSQGLVDTLGEDQPCGFEPPTVTKDGAVVPGLMIKVEPVFLTPAEARAYAAMLVRAAERAEGTE